jgi:hypothetical protein
VSDLNRDGSILLSHELFTNDVLYLEAALDMRPVPADLLPLVPLFCRSLTQASRGGGGRGFESGRRGRRLGCQPGFGGGRLWPDEAPPRRRRPFKASTTACLPLSSLPCASGSLNSLLPSDNRSPRLP